MRTALVIAALALSSCANPPPIGSGRYTLPPETTQDRRDRVAYEDALLRGVSRPALPACFGCLIVLPPMRTDD